MAWSGDRDGDPVIALSALAWSVAALGETTQRVAAVRAWDQERGFAAIADALWQVTMVDAALVRHHAPAYDAALARLEAAQRTVIVETLAGLRFVRNRARHVSDLGEFLDVRPTASGPIVGRITGWRWRSVGEPDLGSRSPQAQDWERTRFGAYQAQLAGRTIGEIFSRGQDFLTAAVAETVSSGDLRANLIG